MNNTLETLKNQRGLWMMIIILFVVFLLEPHAPNTDDGCRALFHFLKGVPHE
jgi:hypothetical protein